MSDNIQTNTTGRLTPCLQKKIDKTTYLVEVHFSATSTPTGETAKNILTKAYSAEYTEDVSYH